MQSICPEVENVSIIPESNTSIHIHWAQPKDCHSVNITLVGQDGSRSNVTASTSKRFDDLVPGMKYKFKLIANYSGFKTSAGFEFEYHNEHMFDPFPIQAEHFIDYVYRVSWDIPIPGIAMRVLVDGVVKTSTTSDNGFVLIPLTANSYYTISAEIKSQNKWTPSLNTEQVCTYLPMGVDIAKVTGAIQETRLHNDYKVSIPISFAGSIPQEVSGFHYVVRKDPSVKWATEEEIYVQDTFTGIRYVEIKKDKKIDSLPYEMRVGSEDEFFVTVFTVYEEYGREKFIPSYASITRPLEAAVHWAVKRDKRRDPPCLKIKIVSNRFMKVVPRLILCICREPAVLSSYQDENAIVVADIPSSKLAMSTLIHEQVYNLPDFESKKMNLFLFPMKDGEHTNSCFKPIPFDGFTGKL